MVPRPYPYNSSRVPSPPPSVGIDSDNEASNIDGIIGTGSVRGPAQFRASSSSAMDSPSGPSSDFGLRRRKKTGGGCKEGSPSSSCTNPQDDDAAPRNGGGGGVSRTSSSASLPRTSSASSFTSLSGRTTYGGTAGNAFPSVLYSLGGGGGGGGGGRGGSASPGGGPHECRDGGRFGDNDASGEDEEGIAAGKFRRVGRNRPDYESGLLLVDRSFKVAAAASLACFYVLLAACYLIADEAQIRRAEGLERTAPTLAFFLLLISVLSKVLPLLFRGGTRRTLSGIMVGGIAVQFIALNADFVMAFLPAPVVVDRVTGVNVHLVRWCEWTPLAFLMTFLTEGVDVPAGSPGKDGLGGSSQQLASLRVPFAVALCQGLSTVCGLFFPYCPGVVSWTVVMIISCLLYFVMFVRLKYKQRLFADVKKGTTVDEQELYNRSRLSLQLLFTCTVMWTILVVSYFVSCVAPAFASEGSWLRDPALSQVSESFMDVVLKVLYMGIIIEVHDAVFDDGARAERRLDELRRMMSVVWGSSSDVIGVSVRGMKGNVTTMISPTYLSFYRGKEVACCSDTRGSESTNGDGLGSIGEGGEESLGGVDTSKTKALVFDFSLEQYRRDGKLPPGADMTWPQRYDSFRRVSQIGGTQGGNGHAEASAAGSMFSTLFSVGAGAASASLSRDELSSLAGLLCRAWDENETKEGAPHSEGGGGGGGNKESLLLHELVAGDDSIQCEAKVTRLEQNALIVVVRDTTERTRRFEAEKQFVFESTARQKDLEANRFTRHEVKNGLLAAIGLCDSLMETFLEEMKRRGLEYDVSAEMSRVSPAALALRNQQQQSRQTSNESKTPGQGILSAAKDRHHQQRFASTQCIGELDKTLHEVLDTVLADAMARDVIHEVYEPRMEDVDICAVLSRQVQGYKARRERFPLITYPSPLPHFRFDPQLLKYIHRNAISNACKYGKKGGAVMTEVRYTESSASGGGRGGALEMNVTNLPGDHHDKLLRLGSAASEAVFQHGRRIHPYLEAEGSEYSGTGVKGLHSSGDGAWIMSKCARTLGGECSIEFEPNRTVFGFRCPATPSARGGSRGGGSTGAGRDGASPSADERRHPRFRIPRGAWGIAIDDSKIQRKLLARFMGMVGIDPARTVVLGKDAGEIQGFVDYVVDFVEQHPDDFLFLIADENLDIIDEECVDSRHLTVSGSLCVESIRKRILPDQERRLLALVRSANDSSNDVAIFNSRAHGFLPKAPLHKREQVLDTMGLLWEKRYPPTVTEALWGSSGASSSSSSGARTTRRSSGEDDGDEHGGGSVLPGDEQAEDLISTAQLMQTVDEIDAICVESDSALSEKWPIIWKKLHGLKGDLLTLEPNDGNDRGNTLKGAVDAINLLRGPMLPNDLVAQWMVIRSLVVSTLDVHRGKGLMRC